MTYELFLLHYGSSSNVKIYFATSKTWDFTWKLKFMALFQRLEYFCHARGISPWCTHKGMGN
jgi:hypothetical protein